MTIRKDVTVAAATVASVVVMGWLSLVVMGNPMLHKVGGSKGWINHDVNYTQWSAQQHVYVGDWLCKFIHIYLFMFLNLIPRKKMI